LQATCIIQFEKKIVVRESDEVLVMSQRVIYSSEDSNAQGQIQESYITGIFRKFCTLRGAIACKITWRKAYRLISRSKYTHQLGVFRKIPYFSHVKKKI
jgi:hypothetical protein